MSESDTGNDGDEVTHRKSQCHRSGGRFLGGGECSAILQQPSPACKRQTPTKEHIWISWNPHKNGLRAYEDNIADDTEEGEKAHRV